MRAGRVVRTPDTHMLICTCESSGRMETPAWPPTTGMEVEAGSRPFSSATNVLARTTSRVVTPNTLPMGAAAA